MLVKLVLAGLLAVAVTAPALAQCVEESASTSQMPVATNDKPAPTSKPAGS